MLRRMSLLEYSRMALRRRISPSLTSVLSIIASQLIGYGMAGIMRIFLVYPTFAVYPQVMPTVQLFEALHRGEGMMSQSKRKKFFWYIFIGIFVWEWFPVRFVSYIITTLLKAAVILGIHCTYPHRYQHLLPR